MGSTAARIFRRARRITFGERSSTLEKGKEFNAGHYDGVYAASDEYSVSYESSRYYSIWTVIVDRIRQSDRSAVLEIGCGSGQLAEFLRDQGLDSYLGFDFSEAAIGLAHGRGMNEDWFAVADAFDTDIYNTARYDTVICTEVLEHVNEDLEIIGNIRPGSRCIFTVPNFAYESHVRHFPDVDSVRSRYGPFLDGLDVYAIRGQDRPDLVYFLLEGWRNDFTADAT